MRILKRHSPFQALTLVLVLAFLLPSAVKFMHVFEQHQHEVCYGEADAHFHTLDFDCEFYKFKVNSPFIIFENANYLLPSPEVVVFNATEYSFLSTFQILHFSHRGPPVISLI